MKLQMVNSEGTQSPSSQNSQKDASSSSSSIPAASSSQNPYKMKLRKVKSEAIQSPSSQQSLKDASSSSILAASSSQNPYKMKLRMYKSEAAQFPSSQKSQKNASISSNFPTSKTQYKRKLQMVKSEAAQSQSSHKLQKDASSSSIPATSSSPNPSKRKRCMVKSEAPIIPESFCGICMDPKATSEIFSNAKVCNHLFCSDCIGSHVSVKVKENMAKVKCPDPNCEGLIGPEVCRSIVPKEVLDRWEDALCESLILATQKFYCPFKDCSAMLVDDSGVAVTSSECPNCNRLFCAQCKVAWHSEMDCREFQSLKNERNPEDLILIKLAKEKKWRRCPRCNFIVEKTGGCNHISCRCGHHFCYRCGEDAKSRDICV